MGIKPRLLLYCTQDVPLCFPGLHASTGNKMSRLWSIAPLQAHEKREIKTGHGYLVTRFASYSTSCFFAQQFSIIHNQCGKSTPVKSGLWLVWWSVSISQFGKKPTITWWRPIFFFKKKIQVVDTAVKVLWLYKQQKKKNIYFCFEFKHYYLLLLLPNICIQYWWCRNWKPH